MHLLLGLSSLLIKIAGLFFEKKIVTFVVLLKN